MYFAQYLVKYAKKKKFQFVCLNMLWSQISRSARRSMYLFVLYNCVAADAHSHTFSVPSESETKAYKRNTFTGASLAARNLLKSETKAH